MPIPSLFTLSISIEHPPPLSRQLLYLAASKCPARDSFAYLFSGTAARALPSLRQLQRLSVPGQSYDADSIVPPYRGIQFGPAAFMTAIAPGHAKRRYVRRFPILVPNMKQRHTISFRNSRRIWMRQKALCAALSHPAGRRLQGRRRMRSQCCKKRCGGRLHGASSGGHPADENANFFPGPRFRPCGALSEDNELSRILCLRSLSPTTRTPFQRRRQITAALFSGRRIHLRKSISATYRKALAKTALDMPRRRPMGTASML